MTRFALTLEFDGGPFMGLQRQDHGPSVQQAVETAVHAVTGETVTMHSAGRTDSGVHALAMRSHVDISKAIEPFRLMEALNARLR
ncbi:MAG: tRNA pseudouridine(38-40) synthase TruA, partial [Croceibacterium sp.]